MKKTNGAAVKQSKPVVTDAQRRVFRNLQQGQEPSAGLSGMSAMGGLDRTLVSMRRRGWLTAQNRLTAAGREVCKQLGIEEQRP